jgi:hypothetical protein
VSHSNAGRNAPREQEVLLVIRSLVLILGLLFATAALSGCIIVPEYHHHDWWAWHHD